jgi:hypothetical protein
MYPVKFRVQAVDQTPCIQKSSMKHAIFTWFTRHALKITQFLIAFGIPSYGR